VCGTSACFIPPPPPPPLNVTIEGETDVPDFFDCTWTAEVSNGTPPYSYQWFRDGDPIEAEGTNAEVTLDTGNEDFVLEVLVEDSGSSAGSSPEVSIDVSSLHTSCTGGGGN